MRSAREITTASLGRSIVYDDDRVELAKIHTDFATGWSDVTCTSCSAKLYTFDEDLPSKVIKALAVITSHYEITHPDDQEQTP